MNHHPSFPVQQRRDLSSCRRDLQMAYQLLLTLLLSSLLLAVGSEAMQTTLSAGLSAKKEGEDEPIKYTAVIVHPYGRNNKEHEHADNDESEYDDRIERSVKRGLQVITVRCGTMDYHRGGGARFALPKRGISTSCYREIDALLKYTPNTKTVFSVFDSTELSGLFQGLTLKFNPDFYIRCMQPSVYDGDVPCRGGPPRPLDAGRFVEGGYAQSKSPGNFVALTEEKKEGYHVVYLDEFVWEVPGNLVVMVNGDIRHVMPNEGGLIRKHGNMIVLSKNDQPGAAEPFRWCRILGQGVFKIPHDKEASNLDFEHNFEENGYLDIAVWTRNYLTPYFDKNYPRKRYGVYVFRLLPYDKKKQQKAVVWNSKTDFLTEGVCYAGGKAVFLDGCLKSAKLPSYTEADIFLVSPALTYMKEFAKTLYANLPSRGDGNFAGLLPKFFLEEGPAPIKTRMGRGLNRAYRGFRSYFSKKYRQERFEAEKRKTIANFSLATFMSARAFNGSVVTISENRVVPEVCWDFIIKYQPRYWLITVGTADGEGAGGIGEETKSFKNRFFQWTLGSWKISDSFDGLKKEKRVPQLDVADWISISRHPDYPDLEKKERKYFIYCDGSQYASDGTTKGVTWDLRSTSIATNRRKDEWYNWTARPTLKIWRDLPEVETRPIRDAFQGGTQGVN